MSIRPIHTDADHEAALRQIGAHWDAPPGSPEHDQLEVLSILVSAYEDKHWPILPPAPVEAIRFHTEQNGLRHSDLATLIGSTSRASDILNRRRGLPVEMIRTIHAAWRIPLVSLVGTEASAATA